jgi:hypothetical protein
MDHPFPDSHLRSLEVGIYTGPSNRRLCLGNPYQFWNKFCSHPMPPSAVDVRFRREYHKWTHLGTGHTTCLCSICGHKGQKLLLAEKEVSFWSPREMPRTSSLVVAKDHVIRAQSERIVVARTERTLGVENCLGKPNPQAHSPEGIFITRTFVQVSQEVPVWILNNIHRAQNSRWDPLTRTASQLRWWLYQLGGSHHIQDLGSKLECIITAAKLHLRNREDQVFQELLTEYEDFFRRSWRGLWED